MAKMYRFKSYRLTEGKTENTDDDVFVKNAAEYYGDAGLYKLIWYPDAKTFRLTFPDGTYLWDRINLLNTTNELNPYFEYEEGKILTWMRHVLMSDEYKRSSIVSDYVLENSSEVEETAINMNRFYYISSDGIAVTFDVSKDGLIVIEIPTRRVSGSPDEVYDRMPEIGYLFSGDLMHHIKSSFEKVTGMPFSE